MRHIKNNKKLFLSGWPIKQNNKASELQRQTFELTPIGLGHAVTTNGEDVKLYWAGAETNDAGAICSFGNSGGEGFTVSKANPTKAESVGVLSSFVDFKGTFSKTKEEATNNRLDWERELRTDLSGFDAICGFGYETPNAQNSEEIVNVIDSLDKIPGHDKKTLIHNAREQFLDANSKRTMTLQTDCPP